MWSLVAGLAICLAAVGGILINIYVLLALLLAKQVHWNKRLFCISFPPIGKFHYQGLKSLQSTQEHFSHSTRSG
jgi:hypothetical protein